MIKTVVFVSALFYAVLGFAKELNNSSKYEINEGKKIYFPVPIKPIKKDVSTEIQKANVKTPLVKAFHVQYDK